jgi:hypothetical protein
LVGCRRPDNLKAADSYGHALAYLSRLAFRPAVVVGGSALASIIGARRLVACRPWWGDSGYGRPPGDGHAAARWWI